MATKYFLFAAPSVAQVTTIQVTAYHASTTYSLLVNGEVICSSISAGSANAVAAALVTAWNAVAGNPYATTITASNTPSDTVKLTADSAGAPFTVTTAVAGGTGTFGTVTLATASSGPNDMSVAANYSDGAVLANDDTLILRDSNVNLCWGLAITATGLTLIVEDSYTGRIGLDRKAFATVANGATTDATRREYREDYLTGDFLKMDVGQTLGPNTAGGSGRIKIDNTRAAASTLTVHRTATTSVDTNLPALRYKAAHANADVFVRNAPAGVGIAIDEPTETSTCGIVAVDDDSRTTRLFIGSGVTLTTYRQRGGDNLLQAAATVTTVDVLGGVLTTEGDYTVTTINCEGGTTYCNHVKTAGNAITTANLAGGTLDATRSTRPRTWATVNLDTGALKADGDYLTITTLNDPAGPYSLSVQ